jgi:hypothetical protein
MNYYIYNIDEYQPLEQGNEFAPTWPFRIAVSGSSDSGKTTMIINLLMGDKKMKEGGERYILCNDVILIGKHLDEPKWGIVKDFYNHLAEEGEDVSFNVILPSEIPDPADFNPKRFTVVIFEDLVNEPKKVQEQIASYFTHGRHSNISPIYVSQRFFGIPKIIRENVTYISLHRGAGSLADVKRIISLYTEHSNRIAPVIDDLTLKKEFIIFDLRRPKDDPLSIRIRWDTSLSSNLNDPSLEGPESSLISEVNGNDINDNSKFNSYGQKVLAEAKANGTLISLAKNMPSPEGRKKLLAKGVWVKNGITWAKYIYREVYGIKEKNIGPGFITFYSQTNSTSTYSKRYQELLSLRPLEHKELIEGLNILLWLFEKQAIDKKTYISGIQEIGNF